MTDFGSTDRAIEDGAATERTPVHLTAIGATDLKGQTFQEAIPRGLLLIGEMGAGKTTRINAVDLAIWGPKGQLGDQPLDGAKARLQFAGAPEVAFLERSLKPHKLEIHKATGKRTKPPVKAGQALIDKTVSPGIRTDEGTVTWHLRDFINMTATERLRFLDTIAEAGETGMTMDTLAERVPAATDAGKILAEARQAYTGQQRLPDFLPWLQEWLAAEYTDTNRNKRDAEGARGRLLEMASSTPRPPGRIEDARKALDDLRDAIQQAKADLAAEQERARTKEARTEAAARARLDLQAAEAMVAELQEQAAHPRPTVPERETDPAMLKAKRAYLAAAKGSDTASTASADTQAKSAALAATISQLDASIERLAGAKTCPLCRSSGKRLKAGLEILRGEREAAAASHAQAIAANTEATAALKAANDAREAAARAGEAARADFDERRRTAQEQATRITTASLKLPAARDTVDDAKKRLATALQEAAQCVLQGTDAIETRLRSLTAQESKAKAALEEHQAAKTRDTDLQKNEGEMATAEARLDAIKVLKRDLGPTGLQGELTQAGLGAVQERAGELIHAATDGRLTFAFRIEDKACRFGCRHGDTWIDYAALSDGEQALTAAGMLLAFAEAADRPWRPLILNGMECLTPTTRRTVLEHVAQALDAGRLDNFIAAAAVTTQDPVDGIEIRNLSA